MDFWGDSGVETSLADRQAWLGLLAESRGGVL